MNMNNEHAATVDLLVDLYFVATQMVPLVLTILLLPANMVIKAMLSLFQNSVKRVKTSSYISAVVSPLSAIFSAASTESLP